MVKDPRSSCRRRLEVCQQMKLVSVEDEHALKYSEDDEDITASLVARCQVGGSNVAFRQHIVTSKSGDQSANSFGSSSSDGP